MRTLSSWYGVAATPPTGPDAPGPGSTITVELSDHVDAKKIGLLVRLMPIGTPVRIT